MSLLLAILYPVAIQYLRGGLWLLVLPITFITFFIDVIANYTELALITWDFPQKGEHTFSERLARLQYNTDFRGKIASIVIPYLNFFDPTGKHIHGKLDTPI